ncbi:MAG: hypothetical protein ACRDCT_18475, partial [Shewanella sp.]
IMKPSLRTGFFAIGYLLFGQRYIGLILFYLLILSLELPSVSDHHACPFHPSNKKPMHKASVWWWDGLILSWLEYLFKQSIRF